MERLGLAKTLWVYANVLTWVPSVPDVARAGWGRACSRVAAALACTSRAFFSTVMLMASDVWRLARAVEVLTMLLVRPTSMRGSLE